VNKKLSCRRETVRCFMSLKIWLSHSSAVGFSVYSIVNRRTGKRIVFIVPFAKCLISEKTRRTDGHRMTAYTACIALRGKNLHFYVTWPSFCVCPGDAPMAITQNVAWMKRQFSACQTPRSMYLSVFNSFKVIRCLSQCVSPKIAIFTTFWFPLGTPLRQSH